MIPFNIPPYIPESSAYIEQAIQNRKICGDGSFTKACNAALEKMTGAKKALLTTSCSSALDLTALLLDIQPGDEVILPSFTFVSTANAFALRGAKIVFVDVDPETMDIDPACVRAAITSKTKAIVAVHYAGVCCDMDELHAIANEYGLHLVTDAAQAVGSKYKGKPAGSLCELCCFSFHETKNLSMGEGGAILINDEAYIERAEIIREKGTDRSRFFRGQVDKYTWVDIGSSFLPSELNAAYLLAQLERIDQINGTRMQRWNQYNEGLSDLEQRGCLVRMKIPAECEHNAHMYYVMTNSLEERTRLISHLKENGISAVFHYIPLHSAKAGQRYGTFAGEDRFTTSLSERLLRLPMYYELTEADTSHVLKAIHSFYA